MLKYLTFMCAIAYQLLEREYSALSLIGDLSAGILRFSAALFLKIFSYSEIFRGVRFAIFGSRWKFALSRGSCVFKTKPIKCGPTTK